MMKSNLSKFDETIASQNFLGPLPSNPLLIQWNSSSSSFLSTINSSSDNGSLDPNSLHDPYQHLTDIIVYKYICLSIFVVGMIGNFLSVLVFSRSSLRHRSCAVYFLALAITDLASLCASFVDTVLPSYNNLTLTIKSLFICKMNPLMIYFTTDLSNFLLAVASIDRAVSIQYPLTSKRFCRAQVAMGLILLMSVIFLGVNGHIFWGFEIVEEANYHACAPSKSKMIWGQSMNYFRFYSIFDSLDMLFAVVIPFIVMLICNILILVRVITSRRSIRAIITTTVHSKKFRKRHEKEKQLTVMLLGSAAAFLVFTLPTEINDTIRAFRPPSTSQPKGAMALITAIFIAMGQFNHAIHFYIYTLTGGIFRNELIKLFTFSGGSRSKSKNKSSSNKRIGKTQQHQQLQTTVLVDIHEV